MTNLPCHLFLLLLLNSLFLHKTIALSPDGLALLAFKSAVSNDPQSSLATWNENDADPCHWPGISCANVTGFSYPRVVGLAVAQRNLTGYIPSELGSLLFLRRLNLHGNNLSGTVPSDLANASSLHSLFLYGNSLTGPFPSALCNLPRLQNLDLSFNSLSGAIPLDLRNCRQLQRLLLSHNKFVGEIPSGVWPEMTGLVQLDLSSNQLNGSIPPDFGQLTSLGGTLNLSHNSFSGEIPAELGKLPSTVSLDLRFNDLTGEIPQAGSLANQGPTAFLNNPGLCGFPLQIICQNQPPPAPPINQTPAPPAQSVSQKKGLRTNLIILISIADAAGVALIGIIMVYIYWKIKDRDNEWCVCSSKGKPGAGGGMCTWCVNGGVNMESTDGEEEDDGEGKEGELVAMDKGFRFELDELLRSSAYVLGKGGKGIVYKVVVGSGIPVAVRRLGGGGGGGSDTGGQQRYKEFAAEAQAIGRVRHPNVVRLRAFYWSQDEKLLISDFIPNGNLATALRGRSGHPKLPWSNRLKIAKGVARGLAHLHDCNQRKYVHGDIKPSNVLLDGECNPHISDFGLNNLVSTTGNTTDMAPFLGPQSSLAGSALPSMKKSSGSFEKPSPYLAPEARVPGARPTQKWDVYSFGLVLMELLTGKPPELASPSTSSGLQVPGLEHVPELVRWVKKGFEDGRPLAEMLDPTILHESHVKKEVISTFHVALACTDGDPEQRPRMKTVSDNLDKLGS
ncbi:Leucine-rich repeat protein kinase family protein [Rhynchospora pubera]|uniref:non-specific serine/threonine protein kinase n=1 Tax=Rhynchospora pubera TaxID=906938 RepID=A0AAV8FXB1_9POAL|nr:Leucine-rich repeat protein kinase family protein [Rhynchospora pubera]